MVQSEKLILGRASAALRQIVPGPGCPDRLKVRHFGPQILPQTRNYMKTIGVSKKPLKKNESLRARVEEDLASIHRDAVLVASFFLAVSVVYTAD